MKERLITAAAFLVLVSVLAAAQADDLSAQQAALKKIDYLVGEWRTLSTFVATGVEAPGYLVYRWILGGNWIHCEFHGQAPGRDYWEAYAMISFDLASGKYRSYAFFGGNAPASYTGVWNGVDTVTFTTDEPDARGRLNRISYKRMPDDTVFQLNEMTDEGGEWVPTLKTNYKHAPAR
ncbi:MAG TPA: DUF1579 family protein [Acidobacteriota bacterium]|nr:DUF1579 family protein [Acidobacteriota bacterium]